MAFPFRKLCSVCSNLCKVFSRQDDAIQYQLSSDDKNLHLFSVENCRNDRRFFFFLVCGLEYFWQEYSRIVERHFYEVVVANWPCRLYFDVEFVYKFNRNIDGNAALCYLITVVCEELYEMFGIETFYENIVDLDSSTDEKFSRHLIFHLPQLQMFLNNEEVGKFVAFVVDKLQNPKDGIRQSTVGATGLSKNHGHGMVKNSSGQEVSLCDSSVYTRNRLFRLFLSSKLAKTKVLKLATSCCFYSSRGNVSPTDEQVFSDSLVCPLPRDFGDTTFELSLLVVGNNDGGSAVAVGSIGSSNVSRSTKVYVGVPTARPDVDKFIVQLASRNVEKGRKCWIRSWTKLWNGNIVYVIAGVRFCYNINREHHRNSVQYVVNLENFTCYQTCLDRDCSHFVSETFAIDFSSFSDL